jgi:hypothetical protein
VETLSELIVLFVREFGWSAFTWIVIDDLFDRLISEPVEPLNPSK